MKKIYSTIIAAFIASSIYAQQDSDSVVVSNSDTFQIDSIKVESVNGGTKAMADSAYINNDFGRAIQIYESLLETGENADVYYNLGNSYYKSDEIAKAIINYERALLIQPGNSDIKANLELARTKTVDKVDATPEIFFISWGKSLVNTMSTNQWSYVAIVTFILFIIGAAIFIVSKSVVTKKVGFFGGMVMLIITLLANIFAWQQKSRLENREYAIVMNPSVVVRSTPSESGTSLFVIHEGHKVKISDSTMKNWKEIKLEDGKVGWVPESSIELI